MAREKQYPTAQRLQPRNIRYCNIRAVYDRDTILVYQAFSREIAEPAAASGSFQGTDFKVDRMTWIKPSYFWTMYRSAWATKSMQEHVLAIKMKRTGFEAALRNSCLAHFEGSTYSTKEEWRAPEDQHRPHPVGPRTRPSAPCSTEKIDPDRPRAGRSVHIRDGLDHRHRRCNRRGALHCRPGIGWSFR